MFSLIRWIAFLLIVIPISIILIKKYKVKLAIVIGGAYVLLLIIDLTIWNYPFENHFVSFDSIESALKYMDNSSYTEKYEGKDSVMLEYTNPNGSHCMIFMSKENGKYKLPDRSFFILVDRYVVNIKSTKYGQIKIYNLENSKDYYMRMIWSTTENINEMYFNGSKIEIEKYEVEGLGNITTIRVNAYLENYPNGNYLEIDGEKIYL